MDPTAIDYALDQLRAACAGHPVDAVRTRLIRTSDMPTTVRADATAAMHGRSIRADSTGHSPQTSIDQLCDRLATKLQQTSTTASRFHQRS